MNEYYIVTVKRYRSVDRNARRWKQVRDTELAEKLGKDKTYEYIEGVETESESAEVYEQRVETLDMPALIRAVNGL